MLFHCINFNLHCLMPDICKWLSKRAERELSQIFVGFEEQHEYLLFLNVYYLWRIPLGEARVR